MSTHKLPFRLLSKKTAIVLLLLVYRLLLLSYVLVVSHNNAVKLISSLRKCANLVQRYNKNPKYARVSGIFYNRCMFKIFV